MIEKPEDLGTLKLMSKGGAFYSAAGMSRSAWERVCVDFKKKRNIWLWDGFGFEAYIRPDELWCIEWSIDK